MKGDLEQYESKVEIIVGIHSQNFLGENDFRNVQKPSLNNHLQINSTCIRMLV
jgi:hypothetical protein